MLGMIAAYQRSVTAGRRACPGIRWLGYVMICLGLHGCSNSREQPNAESEVIRRFVAEPAVITAGQTATLSWDVTGAQEVSLGGLPADTGWSRTTVSPIQTTSYRLTAVTASGESVSREVTVTVNEGPILAKVAIDPSASGPRLPSGFLGLSHGAAQAQLLLGEPSIGVNRVYRQLLANLNRANAGPLTLRIDRPGHDEARIPDLALTAALTSLYHDLSGNGGGVKYILGLDMQQGVPGLARMQAQAYLQNLPPGSIHAFEMGTRPDLFVHNGHREAVYDFAEYQAEYQLYAAQLAELADPRARTIAPSTAVADDSFLNPEQLERLLMGAFDVVSEVGQYPGPAMQDSCSPAALLQPLMSTTTTQQLQPYLTVARRAAKPYRLLDLGSDVCDSGAAARDSFASALWLADMLFEIAYAGVSAVNLRSDLWAVEGGWAQQALFHMAIPAEQYGVSEVQATPPGEDVFGPDYQLRQALPQYYALLFFAEATADQAELLPVALATDRTVKAWAARDRTSGRLSVALINKDPQAYGRVRLDISGYSRGEVKRLSAPSLESRERVRFGGQTFDGSTDGVPVGVEQRERVEPVNGEFVVALGAGSAVLLTLYP